MGGGVNRDAMLAQVAESNAPWDVVVIGGGANRL